MGAGVEITLRAAAAASRVRVCGGERAGGADGEMERWSGGIGMRPV